MHQHWVEDGGVKIKKRLKKETASGAHKPIVEVWSVERCLQVRGGIRKSKWI